MALLDLTPYYQPQGSTSDGTKFDNGLAAIQTTINALDNNNIATSANIAASKLAGLATVITTVNLGSANTDLATPGASRAAFWIASTGGGTLRSIGAPTENGSRVTLRNGSGSSITLKHQLAGGVGSQLYMRTAADVTLADKEIVEFAYDGTNWYEVYRDQATSGGSTPGTELDYAQITASVNVSATTEGTANAVVTGNSITYDGTKVKVEFWCPTVSVTSGNLLHLVLLRDAAVLGHADFNPTASGDSSNTPGYAAVFDTPTAAAHTYKVQAYCAVATPVVGAGAGGAGNLLPAFLRVTKA